jgi:hypothetical protein
MPSPVRTKSGQVLTGSEIDRLAAEAERGLDLATWKPRRGRPRLGATLAAHSPRIAVRVPEDLHRRALARATSERRSMSEVIRGLLEDYAPPASPSATGGDPG